MTGKMPRPWLVPGSSLQASALLAVISYWQKRAKQSQSARFYKRGLDTSILDTPYRIQFMGMISTTTGNKIWGLHNAINITTNLIFALGFLIGKK